MDNKPVIHVSLIVLHAEHVLYVVVYAIRKSYGGDLRDLTSKAEAIVAEALDEILGERNKALVYAATLYLPENGRVLRGIEVFREVEDESVALAPVLSVVPAQGK